MFDIYRTVIWVYGGFLLGILAHAGWVNDESLVFWPWSLTFLLLLGGLVVWQRRRYASSSPAQPEDQRAAR